MNVRLLRRVQKAILEEPKRIHMDTWAIAVGEQDPRRQPECKTVGCIYGWGLALTTRLRGDALADEIGVHDLNYGLFGVDRAAGARLFCVSRWPEKFENRLKKYRPQTKAYAKVVSDRIDHFIATRGLE